MKDKVKIVYKKCGQTPLECINEIKKTNSKLTHLPLTYAGRLDPLAEGVLIILIGDECLKKDKYLKFNKEYEVEILFGFATDTYDVMGKVISFTDKFLGSRMRENEGSDHKNLSMNFTPIIRDTLPQFVGKIKQSYPPYSSRTVKGKPLFKWAREGKLDEIEIPTHDVFVQSIDIIRENFIFGENLFNKIKRDISQVKGDFRQQEIITEWDNLLKDKLEKKYKIITLRIVCGSGVYVRVIANDIGKKVGIPALALNIKRTKVGEYEI